MKLTHMAAVYNEEEFLIITTYCRPLVLGKWFIDTNEAVASRIEPLEDGKGKYSANVKSGPIAISEGFTILKSPIEDVARKLNLLSPAELLKNQKNNW